MTDTLIKLISILLFIISAQSVQGQNKLYLKDSTGKATWTNWYFSINYPKKAADNNIEGAVVVSFDIDSTCAVVNVRLIKGIGYGCDEEAIKSVKNSKRTYPSGFGHRCIPEQGILKTFNFINPDKE
jgi:TonB family protein